MSERFAMWLTNHLDSETVSALFGLSALLWAVAMGLFALRQLGYIFGLWCP